ncbi:MAG: hypothetical protein R3F17_13950 [Planctomycetota bacterium]
MTEGRDTTTVVFPKSRLQVLRDGLPVRTGPSAPRTERVSTRTSNRPWPRCNAAIGKTANAKWRPLTHAPDAIEVLTDGLHIDEVVEILWRQIDLPDKQDRA